MDLNEELKRMKGMMSLNEDSSSPSSTASTGSVWDSGVKRGKGNPVGNTKWESGTTRGKGNPINEKDEEPKDDTKLEDFAEVRMDGAEKIADNAKEKGGIALLTYHHFEVKLEYYEKASKGDFDFSEAKKEYKELLEKLYSDTKDDMGIEQIAFQELVGKIEVLGELIIKNEKGA